MGPAPSSVEGTVSGTVKPHSASPRPVVRFPGKDLLVSTQVVCSSRNQCSVYMTDSLINVSLVTHLSCMFFQKYSQVYLSVTVYPMDTLRKDGHR